MAMILDAFISKCCTLLTDFLYEEAMMMLGVKDELQKLLRTMKRIQCLLKDAEKRKIDESSIDLWLSELKDVMYDADDIIDLCRIKGNQLLADENPRNETSPVCCNFSSTFSSCFTGVPLRHEIGISIKELNDRLHQIYESRKQFKLEKSEILESPQITLVNSRQTSSLADPLVVGGEVEVAANELVDLLITDKVEEKCRIFAIAGMGGIGKTSLAQKIINHPNMQNYFNLKVWICVSQTYSETELLKQLIRKVNGHCGDASTTSELLPILKDSVASSQSLFLVLDDVWRADVWLKLLRVPLQTANTSVRVLVTTRYEAVAKAMKAARTHNVMKLSRESSWDMLRRLLFSDGEEQLSYDLKEIGFHILEKCGGLPLAIKAIAGVLETRERTKIEWENILRSDAWSIRDLHEDHIAALHLSFEDLPSHLKQCFIYFSLYGEDAYLYSSTFARLWVAEGFITQNNEGSLMEEIAEKYFNELLGRNLLLMCTYAHLFHMKNTVICTIHDLVRSLVIFLSKEETSYGGVNVKNSTTFIKLRRLSTGVTNAKEIFDLVAKQGALRTLLASNSDLLLDEEKLKWLSCLRVLDIIFTKIKELPGSIGDLVHLRYLDVSRTEITTVPESMVNLSYLQFLNISSCKNLTQLPNGITQLHNLRYLDMNCTSIRFMPKGIQKLQQLNYLKGFQTDNNDASSKLDDLISLNQLRTLSISNLKGAQTEEIILKELPHLLSMLTLDFSYGGGLIDRCGEPKLAVEELFDKIIPPRSLKELYINNFYGRHFPNWMSSASFENYVPNLIELELYQITSCAQLPPLGQLPELKKLKISHVDEVKKIGPEFLGGDINSTIDIAIAFPKLETLEIVGMYKLEEWFFGVQVEDNASPSPTILPCLHKLIIRHCPLLKSLDHIRFIKELQLYNLTCLERIFGLPMLKELSISECRALSYVKKLDSLQKLIFNDRYMESLPDWLLMILRQHGLQNKDFVLDLTCQKKVFQGCLEGGSYWELIQQIPIVTARDKYGPEGSYLRYNKHPYVYDTKIYDDN